MSKRSLLIIILVWNVLLTAALIWSHTRVGGAKKEVRGLAERIGAGDTAAAYSPVPRDTAGLREGRIAFFLMDTLRSRYELVKETSDRVMSRGRSMDGDLKSRGMAIAQKIQELEEKDQTYSTMAEKEQDAKTYAGLQQQMQELQMEQARKQQDWDNMQVEALQKITGEIRSYLEEYNRTAGFDYIFSIQDGGQVWVGNKGLDITEDIITGLNARHRAKKAAPAPAK